ncbi:MAG: DUF1289 domain-containing protein [Undibacterium sp.]|nr:DUF1289 domain-containing protein [Undibacterium sp.]
MSINKRDVNNMIEEVVASPCIKQCQLDETRQTCIACLRSLDEIMAWSSASNETKRAIWQAIKLRRASVS